MTITTTKCRAHAHPEFFLEADTTHVPDLYLRGLAETVERMVAQGSVFRPGQTFQIGWMLTQIQTHESGLLTLFEPDMRSFPIKWVPGVTETLRQKMVQVFMLDSVSLRNEIKIATIQHSMIVCSRYAEPDFFMTRSEPSNQRDSGWFVGCLDKSHDHNDPSNLKCVSLYEAFLHQRGMQGFVLFPLGAMIVMDRKMGLKLGKGGKDLTIQKGSFLETWFRKQMKGE